jgi:hypothetical protein
MGYLKWILNHLWKIDKLYHAIAGIVIYIVGALLFEPYIGVLLAFAAGAGREIYDEFYRKTGGDPWDFFATITPAIIAFLINLLF